MYAVSRCAVFNGDFISCVSVCQLVLVCPGYDLKLPTPSVGANEPLLLKRRKTANYSLTRLTKLPEMASLTVSGQLQNAFKYCIEVRKMGPDGK